MVKVCYFWFTPPRSNLPICIFQQLVSELSSHKEKPYNLEKIYRDGSLQIWEDYREPGDWIHLILHSLEEDREEFRKSLKRRREISIAENDRQYKEIDTSKVFANGDTKEFDAVIVDLMEKNRAQEEDIRYLKIEQESQAMMLCEITK